MGHGHSRSLEPLDSEVAQPPSSSCISPASHVTVLPSSVRSGTWDVLHAVLHDILHDILHDVTCSYRCETQGPDPDTDGACEVYTHPSHVQTTFSYSP